MLNNLFEILVSVIFLATTLLSLYQNRIYNLSVWKLITMVVVGAAASLAGIYLLAYFEHGYWFRWSFFGCVFCVPIVYYFLSKIIKTPYDVLMDFAGPFCALFFMLIKVNCAAKGCCGGICIYSNVGKSIFFPVQIIEIIGGATILILLLCMQKNGAKRGKLAATFLILFGSIRLVLSFFREEIVYLRFLRDVDIYVPATRLWPLVCIIWGYIWMCRIVSRREGRKVCAKEVVTALLDMFRFSKKEKLTEHA